MNFGSPLPPGVTIPGVGTWAWDRRSSQVDWDESLERMFGLEPGAFGGTFDDWVSRLHPDDRPSALATLDEAIERRTHFRFTHRAVWPDKTQHWLEGRGSLIIEEDEGEVLGAAGIAIDIGHYLTEDARRDLLQSERSARRSLEASWERLAHLQLVAVRLAGAVTVDDVGAVLVDEGGSTLGADGGFFSTVEHDIGQLHLRAHRGAGRDTVEYYRNLSLDADSPAAEVARTGRALYLTSEDERRRRFPDLPHQGADAFVIHPVLVEQEVRAVLSFGYVGAHEFTYEEEELIATIAGMSSQALQRADLHDDAGRAARRSAELESVIGRLAGAATSQEVADIVVASLLPAVGAAKGSLFMFDEPSGSLRALAIHGFSDETARAFASIPLDARTGPTDAFRNEEPVIIEGPDDFARRYPHLADGSALSEASAASFMFPLVVEGHAIGTVGLGFEGPYSDTEEDTRQLAIVAGICAQALGRAIAFENTRLANSRLTSIDQITDAALSRLSLEGLLDELPARIAAAIGCDAVRIFLADDARQVLEVHGQYGTGSDELAEVPIGRGLAGTIAQTGRSRLIEDIDRHEVVRPAFPDHVVSEAGVPLRSGGKVIGVLDVGSGPQRPLTERDIELLEIAADRIATAIDRSRAYELERTTRQRSEFTARLGEIVNRATSLEDELDDLGRLVVDTLADCCVLTVLSELGPSMIVSTHRDATLIDTATQIVDSTVFDPADASGAAEVIRSGKSEFHPVIDSEDLYSVTDVLLRRLCEGLDIAGAMTVPLHGATGPIGAMLLAQGRDSGHFQPEDLSLAEDLAGRMGAAIESRLAFERHRNTAITLQQSLLPSNLPEISGFELAAKYWPASEAFEVGGDFYDVVDLGEGRWGIMVGDVSGKGVGASAMTGIARHTARAAARHGIPPTEVLRWVHDAFLVQAETTGTYCTAVFGILQALDDREFSFRFAVGGHPLPIAKNPSGRAHFVGEPGTVLGLVEQVQFTESEVVLAEGDWLAIYTDGVTDVPVAHAVTDAELIDLVTSWEGSAVSEALDSLDQLLRTRYGETQNRDDTAVLVMRCASPVES